MTTAILLITSITSIVLQNCLFNSTCKTYLKNDAHITRFNMTVYSVCVLIFGILLLKEKISLFTASLGLLFGVVTALSNFYKLAALSCGPMHITLLVTTSSMMIPAMSGIFFGEKFSFPRLCAAFLLIGFIFLSIRKANDTKISKKWIICCLLAFLLQGAVGILQKIHQSSVHKEEVSGFLFISFLCAIGFSLFRNKGSNAKISLPKQTVLIGLVCGVCTFGMNYINLKLSGMLPSQLFFPLINGSAIVLSTFLSVILFREKLSKRQTVGLAGGIASLIGMCLIP